MKKTDQIHQIALKTAKFAKKEGIPLDSINPAFGPLINTALERNKAKKKNNS